MPCPVVLAESTNSLGCQQGGSETAEAHMGKVETVCEQKNEPSQPGEPMNRQDYPGQLLGRPGSGPGSVARIGPRLLAFVLDWYLCWGLLALSGYGSSSVQDSALLLILVWFYQLLTFSLLGHTLGQFLFGMQVQTLDGRPINWLIGLLRSSLIMLVIPVLMMDSNQRGLHDRIRGSILVKIR